MPPQSNTLPSQLNNSNKRQVERIIQLAKLGSDPEAIDPMLDGLRTATADWDGVSPLSDLSRARLKGLEIQLKNYLVNKDPLRKFTPETLEDYLASANTNNSTAKRDAISIIVGSVVAAGIPLLIPVFSFFPFQKSLLLTIPLFLVVLHIGIAWLYLSALSNFKKEFRQAFLFICIGIILLSIAFSHYVMIELFEVGTQELFRYGGLTLLAASCYFFMYIGLRQYAKLMSVKSTSASLLTLFGASVVVVLLAILVPHGGQQGSELYFDLGLAGVWLFSLFLGFCMVISGKITKSVTPAYAKSMKWLHIYFILGFVGSLGSVIALPIIGQLNGGFLYTLIALLGIIPQLMLLYTGYSFKKETAPSLDAS